MNPLSLRSRGNEHAMVDWRVMALTVGTFLAITYALCVAFGLLLPGVGEHRLLERVLPGFRWLTWGGFFIGLVETFIYGLYTGALFAGLYNLFSYLLGRRSPSEVIPPGARPTGAHG